LNGKVVSPGLENRDYGRGEPLRRPRDTLYPLNLALTSPAGGGRSVGIVRLLTEATEFLCLIIRSFFCPEINISQKLSLTCKYDTEINSTELFIPYSRKGTYDTWTPSARIVIFIKILSVPIYL
jgi:hypothetical protein